MRLTKLRRPVRTPAERERRRLSVGKAVYFLVLVLLVFWLGRIAARKAWYLEGDGFVRGEAALVQTVDRARVVWSDVRVRQRVDAGQVVARLAPEGPAAPATPGGPGRARLEAEVRRLEARLRDEMREDRDAASRAVADLLDRIADRERKLRVLRAEREADRARREAVAAEADRWKRLYELEAISLQEYLRRAPVLTAESPAGGARQAALEAEIASLRTRLDELRARRPRPAEETRARLAAARKALEAYRPGPPPGPVATELKAPVGGVITEVYRRPGEVLLEGEALARVVDPSSVYVEAWFPPSAAPRLRPGTPVTLVCETGERGNGRIEAVDPALTPVPGAYQKRYEPPTSALRVRVRPDDPARYAGVLDAGVRVRVARYGGR